MTKKPTKAVTSKDRVVYEVKGPKGTHQIDAATTAELKKALGQTLELEPYSLQAAAHLAHTERATVTGQGWSVKRLGVLAFVPDAPAAAPQRKQPTEDRSPVVQEALPAPEHSQANVDLDKVFDQITTPAEQVQQAE